MPVGLLCELNEKSDERHLVYSKLSKIINNIFEVWIVKPWTNITYFLLLSGKGLFDHVSSLISGFKFSIQFFSLNSLTV